MSCVALTQQCIGEPFFVKESFYSLSTPLFGILGTEDKQQGVLPAKSRYNVFEYWNYSGNNIFVCYQMRTIWILSTVKVEKSMKCNLKIWRS